MLVRRIFKFAYPIATSLDALASYQSLRYSGLYYNTHANFVSNNKRVPKNSTIKQTSANKKTKKTENNNSSSSDSDSEFSSDEDNEVKVMETALKHEQPLTPLRADQVYQEELIESEPLLFVADPETAERPMIKTTYGKAQIINPMLNATKLKKFNTIYYINDQMSISYIRSLLKNDTTSLIVFDPSSHYVNMFGLYNGIKRRILKSFYGSAKKPKNPFKNCKTDKEYFDLHRRILIQQRNMLARICLFVDYRGELRLRSDSHEANPSSTTLRTKIGELTKAENQDSFYRNDFILPISYWLGLNTSDQWEKKGIAIDMLDGKKIYPHYSVWPPTSQNYLSLFGEFVENHKNFLKTRKNTLDIGSGTGVLSFVLNKKCGGGIGDMYAIDSNKKAVECTRVNSHILSLQETLKTHRVDFVDTINKKKIDTVLTNAGMPLKYELMISNPPWLTASSLSAEHELDNGIYDPKGSFLRSVLQFAGTNLTTQTMISKKGVLLLVYSDLSEKLGLQPINHVEELCQKNNLVISSVTSKSFFPEDYIKKESVDPLFRYKKASKVILYEITRP